MPLAMGTADGFVPGLLGLQLASQPFWRGEEGRLALIDGSGKFTDQRYIDAWAFLTAWADYMPDGNQAVSYPDMRHLFTLGVSAVYPAGSGKSRSLTSWWGCLCDWSFPGASTRGRRGLLHQRPHGRGYGHERRYATPGSSAALPGVAGLDRAALLNGKIAAPKNALRMGLTGHMRKTDN